MVSQELDLAFASKQSALTPANEKALEAALDSSKHGTWLAHTYALPPAMSASALMGAMEGLFTTTADAGATSAGVHADAGAHGEAAALRSPATLEAVIKDLGVSKDVRESVRRAARKPGSGDVVMFKSIEPIAQPFLGAWMATSAQFRNLTTVEAFMRQQLVQVRHPFRYPSVALPPPWCLF